MVSVLMLAIAAVQLACVAALPAALREPRVWLLRLVGVGVAYDSAIIGLGSLLGEGDLLHALSMGRFLGHAILTPLLVVWAADRVRMRWFPVWAAWLATVALIAWALLSEVAGLELETRDYADTLRYTAQHPAGPPYPTLVVIALLCVACVVLWRREGLYWPLLGVIGVTVASGAAFAVPPLGNAGEALLLAGLVTAERSRPGRLGAAPPD
ncbi:hypothetical protein ACWDOP_11120 [Nocardia sp. NPDC003693]